MLIGYARTSTLEQEAGFEAQKRELEAVGCERIYSEQVSSVGERAELKKLLGFIREGDVVVVTKIDRLARSMRDLLDIAEKIKKTGANLRILAINLDTNSPTGALMMNVLGSVAEFERAIMLERQKEGISKAKTEGKYKGRKPTARAKASEVIALLEAGYEKTEIASKLKIGRASVYRIIDEAGMTAR